MLQQHEASQRAAPAPREGVSGILSLYASAREWLLWGNTELMVGSGSIAHLEGVHVLRKHEAAA